MKLGQKAVTTLEKWGAFTDDRRSLVIEGDTCSIVGDVTAADKMSCSLSELRVELCNVCHPFFTGKQRLLDVAGRVERFNRKYAGTRKAAAKA